VYLPFRTGTEPTEVEDRPSGVPSDEAARSF
jgi:hypothetical protein